MEGRVGTLQRSRRSFRSYVAEEWLPNHLMELTTRQTYTYQRDRHILPTFGDLPMIEILPASVREWVRKLQTDGVKPPTIKFCMSVLSAIFTTRTQRPGHVLATLHGSEDSAGAQSPATDRQPRTVLRNPCHASQQRDPTARRDRRGNRFCAGASSPNYARAA
ncbi:MAG: hypothetical protein DLM57_04485 [Pseudonocardiales bacterium]|nr:MAG: hypothetical protein DLM57_04485 [Pseudonocardiales bacterium]